LLNPTKETNFNFSGDGNIEDRETSVMPFLEAMANFREVVRNEAKAQKNVNILKVSR
jgi:hypothetical protein